MTKIELTREKKLAKWGPGPWVDEPDHVEWRHNGMPCIMHRQPSSGHWCGYVGVEPGHPWDARAKPMDDEWGADPGYRSAEHEASVHGGVTYGSSCDEETGICHKPLPGEPVDVYWLGFDCAHAWDLRPQSYELARKDPIFFPSHEDVYRDAAYVKAETERLADQAIARRSGPLPVEE